MSDAPAASRLPLWAVPVVAAAGWIVGFLPQLVHQHRIFVAGTLADLLAYAILTSALAGLAAGLRRDRPWPAAVLAVTGAVVAGLAGFGLAGGAPSAYAPLDSGLHLTALACSLLGLALGLGAALGPVALRAPLLAAPAVCLPTWLEALVSAEVPQALVSALLAGALVAVLVASVHRTVDVVSWLPAWILGWLMQAVLTVLDSVGDLVGQGQHVTAALLSSRFSYFHDQWNQPTAHYPAGWALGGLLALCLVGYRLRDNVRL